MSTPRRPLTYANAMATVAVFVSLGGGAYAAGVLPAASVGTNQLKQDSVTSSRVKDGSLRAADLVPGALGAGRRGPAGQDGATGPRGSQGTDGREGARGPVGPEGPRGAAGRDGVDALASTSVKEGAMTTGPGETVSKTVECEGSAVATGGGHAGSPEDVQILDSAPIGHSQVSPPTGWTVRATNTGKDPHTFSVYVICTPNAAQTD